MSDPVKELADRGRALSPEDRVRLLDLLLESLHSGPSASDDEWDQEIARRIARQERGEGALHELDDVMAEAARIAP